MTVLTGLACSRLQHSGEKSFSKNECEKRAGAGKRQGAFFPFSPAATTPFPKSRASYFHFARFNTSPLYYLRAWHRLAGFHCKYHLGWGYVHMHYTAWFLRSHSLLSEWWSRDGIALKKIIHSSAFKKSFVYNHCIGVNGSRYGKSLWYPSLKKVMTDSCEYNLQ